MNQSKEIGLRIRRARHARNWSQEKLAEKAELTTATISKYETDGLADIDKIKMLSEILGQDLLVEERDAEGTVNEIGRQIIIELIKSDGYMDYEKMVKEHLFGLNDTVSTEEIVKIERLGMCVREQYTDFYDKERDGLFLTAKGLIFCKNTTNNPIVQNELESHLAKVVTYEELLRDHKGWGIKDANSYQEYIELRPAEKLVRNLVIDGNDFHLINYVDWLQKNFESGLEQDEYPENQVPTLVPSVSFQYDLLYRMANDITNEKLDVFGRKTVTDEKAAGDTEAHIEDENEADIEATNVAEKLTDIDVVPLSA